MSTRFNPATPFGAFNQQADAIVNGVHHGRVQFSVLVPRVGTLSSSVLDRTTGLRELGFPMTVVRLASRYHPQFVLHEFGHRTGNRIGYRVHGWVATETDLPEGRVGRVIFAVANRLDRSAQLIWRVAQILHPDGIPHEDIVVYGMTADHHARGLARRQAFDERRQVESTVRRAERVLAEERRKANRKPSIRQIIRTAIEVARDDSFAAELEVLRDAEDGLL